MRYALVKHYYPAESILLDPSFLLPLLLVQLLLVQQLDHRHLLLNLVIKRQHFHLRLLYLFVLSAFKGS